MKNFLSDSRAQARDWFTVIIILFISGFLLILCYFIMDAYIDQMSLSGYLTGPAIAASQGFLWGLRIGDYIIVLLMVVLIVGIAITSYQIATKKVYFIVTIILAAFYGFISYFFNYMFQQMVSEATFSATIGYFPNTLLVCTNLHWVMLITIVVGSIGLYAKQEKGQYIQ